MKKLVPILVSLLSVVAVIATHYISDDKSPLINVNDIPEISCSLSYDDLLSYASSNDSDLKFLFVEEKSLSEIADNGYLTYVAIDTNNNVSKEKADVSISPELVNYHIELLQPLKAQIHETFKTSEYLVLKNDCGWNIKDSFDIDGVDYDLKGEYEVNVSVKSHSNVEPLTTIMEVKDFKAPVINLKNESIETSSNLYFSDGWFLENIDSVEDDEDDRTELIKKVSTNWKDVMFPTSTGFVSKEGTYTITYRVTDSDGNTGTTTLRLILKKQEGNDNE